VVLTPTFIRGFNASVDYYDITVNDLIASYGGLFLVNTCATSGDPTICSYVQRDTRGLLFTDGTKLLNLTHNTGFIKTRGVDVEANYRTSFTDMGMGDWGALAFNFVGTYTDKLQFQPVPASVPGGGGVYDCAGLFGPTCGGFAAPVIPKWRHKLRMTWTTPWNLGLSVNWRYLSGADLDLLDSNPLLQAQGPNFKDTIDAHIKAYNYFDLAATWTVRDGTTLRAGVNNVFDKDPPLVDTNSIGISSPPFGNGNTYPAVYDSLGRTFFVGITADF
jgi:outer membrane receptor protein involved in Fe transport